MQFHCASIVKTHAAHVLHMLCFDRIHFIHRDGYCHSLDTTHGQKGTRKQLNEQCSSIFIRYLMRLFFVFDPFVWYLTYDDELFRNVYVL